MTNAQIEARKLELKKQFLQVRGIDRLDKIERAIFVAILRRYETQIKENFDYDLSKKIDCLRYLVES